MEGGIKMASNVEYFQRGHAYYNEGKYDLAIEEATKANISDPNDPTVVPIYGLRGLAYKARFETQKNMGDCDLAIADFTKIIELYPNGAIAYHNRGILYGYKNDPDRALVDYEAALRLDPNDAVAYLHRGMLYGGKGDISRAIADFEAVLRIEPDNYPAKFWLEKIRQAAG